MVKSLAISAYFFMKFKRDNQGRAINKDGSMRKVWSRVRGEYFSEQDEYSKRGHREIIFGDYADELI